MINIRSRTRARVGRREHRALPSFNPVDSQALPSPG
jgi:hypothetical protein